MWRCTCMLYITLIIYMNVSTHNSRDSTLCVHVMPIQAVFYLVELDTHVRSFAFFLQVSYQVYCASDPAPIHCYQNNTLEFEWVHARCESTTTIVLQNVSVGYEPWCDMEPLERNDPYFVYLLNHTEYLNGSSLTVTTLDVFDKSLQLPPIFKPCGLRRTHNRTDLELGYCCIPAGV